MQSVSSPFVMVIFGATGDLTQRKLIPALFHLYQRRVLPEHFYIVGFSRREYSQDDFKAYLHTALQKYHRHEFSEELWKKFSAQFHYQQGNFDEPDGYKALIEKLAQFDELLKSCIPRFFYLATPPDNYQSILTHLHTTKLSEGCGQGSDKWTKVMIEKPFGKSLEDARRLDAQLARFFKEEQIFRIDHYLGKETVQNLLAFRFGNTIFDPVWNNRFIDQVQITIAETGGVEKRGNFYEGVGALRDMAQSHLLELMAAITMKQPQTFDARGIRTARTHSIEKIRFSDIDLIAVRGQYGSGLTSDSAGQERKIPGYREEMNVSNRSNTETFVALKLMTDDPQWTQVPFYLRTGKRLRQQTTEISVVFKAPTLKMLGESPREVVANVLTFNIQPKEGIELTLNAKKIGLQTSFEPVPMSFNYKRERDTTDAYERLLLDTMRGDQTLFTATDEVVASWRLISKIVESWSKSGSPHFPNYRASSWGPVESLELIERDGREWILK
jgi:glucose-6-phosphate 1-dehydrogenase